MRISDRPGARVTSRRPVMSPCKVALLVASLVLSGCVAQAAENRDVMADDPLLAGAGLDDQGAWQSAPWTRARWIPYPGRGTVTVYHGLGRIPTSVEVYLSGEPDDTDKDSVRFSFAGSGNIVTIDAIDEESVKIRNNTAGKFFVRVVLR